MSSHDKFTAIRQRKDASGQMSKRISALTAYDYPTARLLDEGGIDVLLVGDSLGMVVLGFPDTTHVTLAHMIHHTEAVARATPQALVISDLPINTYSDPKTALKNAQLLIAAGANAVKLEGGQDIQEIVHTLTENHIPVCGHLGMLPQNVLQEGGYKKKGKNASQIDALKKDLSALLDAGVFAIVLESIVPEVAAALTAASSVPTIGIGCGETTCDGEVAVISDLIGSYPWFVPPFAKPEADISKAIRQSCEKFIARVQG